VSAEITTITAPAGKLKLNEKYKPAIPNINPRIIELIIIFFKSLKILFAMLGGIVNIAITRIMPAALISKIMEDVINIIIQ